MKNLVLVLAFCCIVMAGKSFLTTTPKSFPRHLAHSTHVRTASASIVCFYAYGDSENEVLSNARTIGKKISESGDTNIISIVIRPRKSRVGNYEMCLMLDDSAVIKIDGDVLAHHLVI